MQFRIVTETKDELCLAMGLMNKQMFPLKQRQIMQGEKLEW